MLEQWNRCLDSKVSLEWLKGCFNNANILKNNSIKLTSHEKKKRKEC